MMFQCSLRWGGLRSDSTLVQAFSRSKWLDKVQEQGNVIKLRAFTVKLKPLGNGRCMFK
jgi:hypothetical protein